MSIGNGSSVLTSILDRLDRLEQQARQPSGEQLTPNYLTLSPTGQIGANFTGIINALGLVLKEATSGSLIPASAAVWEDAAGVVREWIQGFSSGSQHQLALNIPDPTYPVEIILAGEGGGLTAGVSVGAGGAFPLLINRLGDSSFLQLLSPQALHLDFGQQTLTWTASNLSATATVSHGLGTSPQVVLATAVGAPGPGEVPALNTFSYTSTQFNLNGDVRTSGSFSCNVNWLAIG